jgi:hypothetical protein
MTTEKKVTTATKVIYWVTTALIALSALSGVFYRKNAPFGIADVVCL